MLVLMLIIQIFNIITYFKAIRSMYAQLIVNDLILIYHFVTASDSKMTNSNGENVNLMTMIFFVMLHIDRVFLLMLFRNKKL